MEALKSELNTRGIGGESFQTQVIFEEMKTRQDLFLERMNSLLTPSTGVSGMVTAGVSGGDLNRPNIVVDEAMLDEFIVTGHTNDNEVDRTEEDTNRSKGFVIQWENCESGRYCLVPKTFKLPVGITLSNLFCMFLLEIAQAVFHHIVC